MDQVIRRRRLRPNTLRRIFDTRQWDAIVCGFRLLITAVQIPLLAPTIHTYEKSADYVRLRGWSSAYGSFLISITYNIVSIFRATAMTSFCGPCFCSILSWNSCIHGSYCLAHWPRIQRARPLPFLVMCSVQSDSLDWWT